MTQLAVTPIQQRCAWCGVLIRAGRLTLDGHESHGICEPCRKGAFPEYEPQREQLGQEAK